MLVKVGNTYKITAKNSEWLSYDREGVVIGLDTDYECTENVYIVKVQDGEGERDWHEESWKFEPNGVIIEQYNNDAYSYFYELTLLEQNAHYNAKIKK